VVATACPRSGWNGDDSAAGMILLYTVPGRHVVVLVTDYIQFIVKGAGIVVTSILVITSLGWSNLVHGCAIAGKAPAVRRPDPGRASVQSIARE